MNISEKYSLENNHPDGDHFEVKIVITDMFLLRYQPLYGLSYHDTVLKYLHTNIQINYI